MNRKSQQELEQSAKVYQLDAVEAKVDQALKKLDEIAASVNGVVTNAQLEARLMQVRQEVNSDIEGSIEKIHLEYRPVKNAGFWVSSIVITALVGQIVWQIFRN